MLLMALEQLQFWNDRSLFLLIITPKPCLKLPVIPQRQLIWHGVRSLDLCLALILQGKMLRSNSVDKIWTKVLLLHCQVFPQIFPETQFSKLLRYTSIQDFLYPGFISYLKTNQALPQLSYVGPPFVTCFVALNGCWLSLLGLVALRTFKKWPSE